MQPLVSILIPCYNGAPWVHRAIETALAQTWPNKEVVVLDDGSTDNSLEIIHRYAGRVRIATQVNGGQNVSRNHLTQLSRGEWLVYLDADDELAPDSVEKKMQFADEADAIYGTFEIACFVGQEKTRASFKAALDFADPVAAAFNWEFPNTSSFVFRRSAIVEVGQWNTAIKNCTDYDVYFKLLMKGKRFRAAPDSLSLYRQWSLNQAVYQDPSRKLRTRLQMMWIFAQELKSTGRLYANRKTAFEQATFGLIRMLGLTDRREAARHQTQLMEWDAHFSPKACTTYYQLAYLLFGFNAAELLAGLGRRLNPIKKPVPGTDPKSGLPYV